MTADTVGGVWTYALELARALGKYSIDVAIATMGPEPSRPQCEEASAIRNVDLFKSGYKLEWMQDPWSEVRAAGEWLLSLERRLKPDLVHLNGYAHAALPWKSPKLVVGHSCVYSWWRAVRSRKPPAEWNAYKTAVQRGLRAADLVVAPTQAMLDALNENYPLCIGERGRVVSNGLDPHDFSPALKQKFIFTAGRLWDEAKNIQTLAGVAWQLPWALCLAGEKQNADNGVSLVLKDNCYALGNLPRDVLRRWYSCAAIYVLPARYEPFGLTVLEAALSGCALVLGDIESLRENWGEAAVFVNPEDRLGMRDVLFKLVNDEGYRARLGRAAREHALQFSAGAMAEQYVDVYRNLLSRRDTEAVFACAS